MVPFWEVFTEYIIPVSVEIDWISVSGCASNPYQYIGMVYFTDGTKANWDTWIDQSWNLPSDVQTSSSIATGGGDGVGQPGTWESLIPIWGSGRAAIDHFQNGNWGRGLLNTGIAISDVFLVKSIGTAIGKGAWKLGSHSWSATRRWLGQAGYAEAGQPVHHWAVSQATAKQYGLEAITNQPWNLMPMSSQAFHQSLHGVGPNAFGPVGQFWYGTPIWFKTTIVSGSGRIGE
jgi:hypothetical protein